MTQLKIVLFILVLAVLPYTTHAADETITSFDARIIVNENATIEVTEQIVYDFYNEERHGIFRNIPYSYQAGTETYTAEVGSVFVTDEQGQPLPFSESRGNGELTLKIGNPKVTVTGEHTYVISYVVEGPFLYFDEYDEFYWNVTGYWERPIERASVLVDLPRGASVISAACYQGIDGARISCSSDDRLLNSERAGYTAVADSLATEEGLTVAVAFPKGTILEIEKPWQKKDVFTSSMLWPLGIPILVLFFMLYLWDTRGRDPKGRGTIVTEFTPPDGMSPAVAGVVYNERVENREISAEIIRLAVEGYIKIHRINEKVLGIFPITEYLFERVSEKVPEDEIDVYILESFFRTAFMGTVTVRGEEKKGALLSKMRHKFTQEKTSIEKRIYQQGVDQGYFIARPDNIRNMYIAGGIGVIITGIALAIVFGEHVQLLLVGVAVALSGGLVAVVGNWMPVKTKEGVRTHEHLEGFRRYLDVAEKNRIAFHNAPEKTPELFDIYLPYAMIFGVEKQWAEQFKDMYLEEPSWYGGSAGTAFAVSDFASDMASFTSDFSSASAPKSSGSRGGGSSGGGFGGGGGGSW